MLDNFPLVERASARSSETLSRGVVLFASRADYEGEFGLGRLYLPPSQR